MRELLIDFITSLDGYASGEGWPGWWGLEGPEYLAWLGEQPPVTYLMGANTYRLMSGFAGGEMPAGTAAIEAEEEASLDEFEEATLRVLDADVPYTPGYMQVYCEGAAMRQLAHREPIMAEEAPVLRGPSLLAPGLFSRYW